MTRFILRVGLLLMVAFAALGALAGVVGGVLPYEGEIRYFLERTDRTVTPYAMDVLRGVAFQTRPLFNFYNPYWSPNGQYFTASTNEGATSYLGITYVMDIYGGTPRLMPDQTSYVWWTSDNSYLYFSTYENSNASLYIANGDGTNITSVFTAQTSADYPSLSPDNTRLAYIKNGDLFVLNLANRSSLRLTYSPDQIETLPSWSPDGQQIAFWNRNADSLHLWVIDSSGENLRDLTVINLVFTDIVWSPDSSQMSVLGTQRTGTYFIYVISIDTAVAHMLPVSYDPNIGLDIEWGGDDTLLLYGWENLGFYQDTVDVATGEVLQRIVPYRSYLQSSNERWFVTLDANNHICINARDTGETQRCFFIRGGTARNLIWLP